MVRMLQLADRQRLYFELIMMPNYTVVSTPVVSDMCQQQDLAGAVLMCLQGKCDMLWAGTCSRSAVHQNSNVAAIDECPLTNEIAL